MLRVSIIFLGSAGGAPTRSRHLASILVTDGERYILLDAGEGAQYRVLDVELSVHRITHILITHLHGDHVFGLPGLLASMTLLNRVSELKIVGPTGITEFVNNHVIKYVGGLPFRCDIKEVSPPSEVVKVYQFKRKFSIHVVAAKHSVPALAYSLTWTLPKGKFVPEKAVALNVPVRYWKRLHYGETVVLRDGRVIRPEDVLIPRDRSFLKITYTGDTAPSDSIVDLARDSDVLIHDSTFGSDVDGEVVWRQGHSRAVDAAEIARRANVRLLVLTHVSSRYESCMHEILEEARAVFPNTILAQDLMKINVILP